MSKIYLFVGEVPSFDYVYGPLKLFASPPPKYVCRISIINYIVGIPTRDSCKPPTPTHEIKSFMYATGLGYDNT